MGAGRNHLGDDGYTGFLGEGRLPKSDPRIEALGALDETNSVLGLARTTCHVVSASDWIIQIQRDLYMVMSEVASEPELADHFPTLKNDRLSWLDDLISSMESRIPSLQGFILPGDSFSSAILDLSRTVTRRAERRVVEFFHQKGITDHIILRYLNRLSTFCFTLELLEIQAGGESRLTLAKEPR